MKSGIIYLYARARVLRMAGGSAQVNVLGFFNSSELLTLSLFNQRICRNSWIMLKSILQALKKIFFGIIIIIATIIIVRAFDARRMPDLDLWHTEQLESEFQADKADTDTTFEDYLRIESRLLKEVSRKVVFDAVLLHTSERRIGNNDFDPILVTVVFVRAG